MAFRPRGISGFHPRSTPYRDRIDTLLERKLRRSCKPVEGWPKSLRLVSCKALLHESRLETGIPFHPGRNSFYMVWLGHILVVT